MVDLGTIFDCITPRFKIIIISKWKYLQVCELYTGRKNAEEWSFLPETWCHELCAHQYSKKIIFNQNFVLLNFRHSKEIQRRSHGDFLVLNLATRKQFWAWKNSIDNAMKTKVTDFYHLGRRFDFNNDSRVVQDRP